MKIAHVIDDFAAALSTWRKLAFVPTMGNLHDGRIALVSQARTMGDACVASIFLNRLQFLPHKEFDRDPRTWYTDCARLEAAGCSRAGSVPKRSSCHPAQGHGRDPHGRQPG